ncbi:MAG: HEAT repeat domain-containing protein [bacterium]|nr:HEAT repeat domain-containing protein [bacterium]
MTTTRELLKQLRHSDPEKRKAAIKGLARAKEKDAIVPLAKMGGDDKDAEVRELALKAGRYILEQTGGLQEMERKTAKVNATTPPPAEEPKDSKKKPLVFHVSDADSQKAAKLLDEAMTYQMRGEKAKMMKALSRALSTNPNLRYDSFFASLAEDATGKPLAEAVTILDDEDVQKAQAKQVVDARKQKKIDEHLATVSRTSWRDVVFDLAVYGVVMLFGVIVVSFVIVQTAQAFANRYEQNLLDWSRAVCETDNNGERVCLVQPTFEESEAGQTEPREVTLMEPDPTFLTTIESVRQIPLSRILVQGGLASVLGVVLMALLSVIIHGLSSLAFGGRGTLPHLAHSLTSFITNRTILILILIGAIGAVFLSSGTALVLTIGGGLIGLMSLLVFFKLVSITGQTYDYGFAKGFIATLIALVVVGAVGGGAGLFIL